jgi:hypothetical protein
MPEPRELTKARQCLARAEASLSSADGLMQLVEGLALLDDVIGASTAAASTARNLAASYAARIYARVGDAVAGDAQLPEPELEHFFKVVLAFDQVGAALPESAQELKIAVVRRLIDRYYEGHPPEKKQRALDELAQLARRE